MFCTDMAGSSHGSTAESAICVVDVGICLLVVFVQKPGEELLAEWIRFSWANLDGNWRELSYLA